MEPAKRLVQDFWQAQSCGEVYAQGSSLAERLAAEAATRYALEPYIPEFARFADSHGRRLLEVGVGIGADHLQWARAGAVLYGVDLTQRAIDFTRDRLQIHGVRSELSVADAENLPFCDESFDLVYSWGVLHHTPDTARAINEVWRVLRPGGSARMMLYQRDSLVGYLLWTRYALLAAKPWRSLREVYAQHMESPGTNAYTPAEIRALCRRFSTVRLRSQLSFVDLLQGAVGQRHRGALLTIARKVWPRSLIRRFLSNHGLYLLIDAEK